MDGRNRVRFSQSAAIETARQVELSTSKPSRVQSLRPAQSRWRIFSNMAVEENIICDRLWGWAINDQLMETDRGSRSRILPSLELYRHRNPRSYVPQLVRIQIKESLYRHIAFLSLTCTFNPQTHHDDGGSSRWRRSKRIERRIKEIEYLHKCQLRRRSPRQYR